MKRIYMIFSIVCNLIMCNRYANVEQLILFIQSKSYWSRIYLCNHTVFLGATVYECPLPMRLSFVKFKYISKVKLQYDFQYKPLQVSMTVHK